MATADVASSTAPSRAEFEERYVQTSTPVILRGLCDDWPAHARWNDDHLRRFADYPIPAVSTGNNLLGDFLRALETGQDAYAVLSPFDLPAWLADVRVPPLVAREELTRSMIWMGSSGRHSLHYDDAENLHTIIRGEKTFLLIAPHEQIYVYPVDARRQAQLGINRSQVDLFAPDFARFPNLRRVTVLRAELGPRDTLYVPGFWWHAVEHRGRPTIAVNFWWVSASSDALSRSQAFFSDRLLLAQLKAQLGGRR